MTVLPVSMYQPVQALNAGMSFHLQQQNGQTVEISMAAADLTDVQDDSQHLNIKEESMQHLREGDDNFSAEGEDKMICS